MFVSMRTIFQQARGMQIPASLYLEVRRPGPCTPRRASRACGQARTIPPWRRARRLSRPNTLPTHRHPRAFVPRPAPPQLALVFHELMADHMARACRAFHFRTCWIKDLVQQRSAASQQLRVDEAAAAAAGRQQTRFTVDRFYRQILTPLPVGPISSAVGEQERAPAPVQALA